MNSTKINSKKIKAASLIVSFSLILSACSVDVNKLKEAFIDLGEGLESSFLGDENDVQETVAITETVVETSSEVAETHPESFKETIPSEPTDTPTPTPTEAPTPTPTEEPTPTPTLPPERVDFSELTDDVLADDITLLTEDFEEHYAIGEDISIADFSGNRILLSSENNIVAVNAINLYLNGFYCEAEGMYFRYRSEALAETGILTGMIPTEYSEDLEEDEDIDEETEEFDIDTFEIAEEDMYHVVITYDYHKAGRVFSVDMSYVVMKGEEEITSSSESLLVDIYTGQKITLDMLFSDTEVLMNSINEIILEESEVNKAKVSDIHDVYIYIDSDDDEPIFIVNGYVKDEEISVEIDIDEYDEIITRYGKIVLF